MKTLATTLLLLATAPAFADCTNTLALSGAETVAGCDPAKDNCVAAGPALYQYLQAADDDDARLTVALQTSPWRMYGPDLRIITPAEMAESIRAHAVDPVRKVELIGSWTGVAPDADTPSLAAQVSTALEGFPVAGLDGFLWVAADGTTRTTQQAFTVRAGGGMYRIRRGDEVMSALIVGWASPLEDTLIANGDGELLLHAAVGWDAFSLCPEHALATFEKAAQMGNPIAAYNAALMRLERAGAGDVAAARVLLQRAVSLGDGPAAARLRALPPAP